MTSKPCGFSWFFSLPALAVVCAAPALAGGVAIERVVLSDDGDSDGFADAGETVSMQLVVKNTSGIPLTDVIVQVASRSPALACITDGTITIGNLAVDQVLTTSDTVTFVVPGGIDRTALGLGPLDLLAVAFDVSVTSNPADQPAYPPELRLDLDLDVSGGSGNTSFFESFQDSMGDGTLGAFEIENMESALHSLAAADGFRCQYNDPDWPNSNTYGSSSATSCFPGASQTQADAVFWGLSGPAFSPAGGRGFGDFHSLFFGQDLGPPENWTTPLAVLEAVKTSDPIHLGWDEVHPELHFVHQVSFVDSRIETQLGTTLDRGIVMAQVADGAGNGVGPWIRLEPWQNPYEQVDAYYYQYCSFDPTDDGNSEDDFFDPSDPERRFGPSSSCFPQLVFSRSGETSNPFDPANTELADGPGLQGIWGIGTWVEPRFDLSPFRGRSIRLRLLAATLKFGNTESYQGIYDWNPVPFDDGWWIDDVTVDGALTTAATAIIDVNPNPALPLPDGDTDGVFNVCDNCVATANTDQLDWDSDGAGNLCDVCPLDPTDLDDDMDGVCNLPDNCPQVPNTDQTNDDSDGFGLACDCNDNNSAVYPGAPERNDGVDNQCPGDEGHGLVDEIAPTMIFTSRDWLDWEHQSGAVWYDLATAEAFIPQDGNEPRQAFCVFATTSSTNATVSANPMPGWLNFYLVSASLPIPGSWGAATAGERNFLRRPCT